MIDAQFDNSICICGRQNYKPHCPYCGSAQVLCSVRKRDYMTRPDGTQVELRVYACRVCGSRFNDEQRTRCGALPPRGQRSDNRALDSQEMQQRAHTVAQDVGELVKQPSALEKELERLRKKYTKE